MAAVFSSWNLLSFSHANDGSGSWCFVWYILTVHHCTQKNVSQRKPQFCHNSVTVPVALRQTQLNNDCLHHDPVMLIITIININITIKVASSHEFNLNITCCNIYNKILFRTQTWKLLFFNRFLNLPVKYKLTSFLIKNNFKSWINLCFVIYINLMVLFNLIKQF